MNDLTPLPLTPERTVSLLQDAQKRIDGFVVGQDSGPGLASDVLRLLGSLPFQQYVDARVELAWNFVAKALVLQDEFNVARAVLAAALPKGAELRDRRLHRRWLLATALCDAYAGQSTSALKGYAAALHLSREIGEPIGEAAVLVNLALLASGAGRYREVLLLTERALQVCEEVRSGFGDILRSATITRANALFRSGRLDEAYASCGVGIASCAGSTTRRDRNAHVTGLALMAEISLLQGRAFPARVFLANAKAMMDSGTRDQKAAQQRIEGLLAIADGELERGVGLIEACVTDNASSYDDASMDALHALERVFRANGEHARADAYLRRIGDRMVSSTARIVDGLREIPSLAEHLALDADSSEIDRYIAAKRVAVTPVTQGARADSWEHLIAASASASSAEDDTLEHGVRVACLARCLALAAGETPPSAEAIARGALVHDIGKLGVPPLVLARTETLTVGEQEMYEAHSQVGADLLERAEFPHKRVVANVARYHHAPFDGVGASFNLKGDAIPLEARIVGVCDAFDAFVMGRPRRPAMPPAAALSEILQQRGRDFDPKLVDLLIDLVRRLQREHPDLMNYLAEEAEHIEHFATQRMLRRAVQGA